MKVNNVRKMLYRYYRMMTRMNLDNEVESCSSIAIKLSITRI